jgi:hypothetical protein
VLDQRRFEPFPEEFPSDGAELRHLRQQSAEGTRARFAFAELRGCGGEKHLCPVEIGKVGLDRFVDSAAVIALLVLVQHQEHPIPARVMRIQFHRSVDQSAAAFPVAGVGDQERRLVAAIERIQRQRPLRGGETGGRFLAKEPRHGQRLIRDLVGRRSFDGALRRCQRTIERSGSGVEAMGMLV